MLSPDSVDRPVPIRAGLADSLANTAVWRAGELGGESRPVICTGHAGLDAVLPGGGWPQGALVEILQPQAGISEWGLVAPGLASLQTDSPRQLIVLVGAPALPFGPALGAQELQMRRLLSVRAGKGQAPELLWATREALQCADVAAVLAWLPDARSAHLRRLQIAAHAHDKLLFVFRPLRAQHESSPAPLRLLLEGQAAEIGGGNLRVHVLKRRGPPLALPLLLDTRHERLTALLEAHRERVRRQREELDRQSPSLQTVQAALSRLGALPSTPISTPETSDTLHALLDRLANLHH
ncbi:MAG: translesion DNA synthesis-associated protein ImuA [Comamonadaceae bacterium]|nr:MAG: translesion DNA synthesis-associated protein ImuA [Comamonadaceae bacterium]